MAKHTPRATRVEPNPSIQVVRRYATLAAQAATVNTTGVDGRLKGTVKGLAGVWAIGSTEEEVRRELADVVVDWALAKMSDRDGDIPILGGIDLNA